jgi:dinuclear metal center YbgI/SA1388 family protein
MEHTLKKLTSSPLMGECMKSQEMVSFLDEYLSIHTIEDDSNNGLQIQSDGEIETVGFAVDACLDVFEQAHARGCDMLVVHHGIIWGGIPYITNASYERVKFLIQHNMGLYAAHLPLDIHKEIGNNTQIARLLGVKSVKGFCPYKNVTIGLLCEGEISVSDIVERMDASFHTHRLWKFGPDISKKIGIITGSGTSCLDAAIQEGCDTFITGEPKHMAYHQAEEARINVICAGHYQTETLGVKALMEKIEDRFPVCVMFIDSPTGL